MEPKDFARVILRRKSSVITAIIIVMATVFVLGMQKQPLYPTECKVLFQATGADITNQDLKSIETLGTLETNAEVLGGPTIGYPAAAALKLPAAQVLNTVNVTVQPGTQVFILKVAQPELPSPTHPEWKGHPGLRSAAICNAYGTAYVDYKRAQATEVYKKAIRKKETSLAIVYSSYRDAQSKFETAKNAADQYTAELTRNELGKQLTDLQGEVSGLKNQLLDGVDGGGKLLSPAGEGAKNGGDPTKSLILGFIVGLMFGVGIALVREYLDDTVRDKESTQRELGLSVLATMPAEAMESFGGPSSATIEAARTLRTTLASLGFPHEKSVLLITSTLAKRRSTTLASLAAAVAESGRSVLVIGSDLRGARTHEAFGVANSVGLANVLRGQIQFERAIRPAPGMDGVYVLPCGPMIGNPGELLSSEEMAITIAKARRWADVVLLDAPPVLAAADSSVLGAYAEGVILVVSAGQTNRSHANEAKEQLVAAGARVLGAVLVGSEESNQRSGSLDGSGYGEDLPSLVPYGTWNDQSYGDEWYEEGDVLTATARMTPRQNSARRAEQKKISAASVRQRPSSGRPRTAGVPRNARTAGGNRSASASAGRGSRPAPRASAPRPSAPRAAASRPAAPRAATRPASRSTAARPAPARRAAPAGRATASRPASVGRAAPSRTAASRPAARPAARPTAARTTAARPTAARPTAARPTAARTTARTTAARTTAARTTAARTTAAPKRATAPARTASKPASRQAPRRAR